MSINKGYIDNSNVTVSWHKMKIDDLKFVDEFFCSKELKIRIKLFFKVRIEQGYLFTTDIEETELEYDGFEYFIGYKETENSVGEVKCFCEYYEENTADVLWWNEEEY